MSIPNIWKNKKCSEPPNSILIIIYIMYILHMLQKQCWHIFSDDFELPQKNSLTEAFQRAGQSETSDTFCGRRQRIGDTQSYRSFGCRVWYSRDLHTRGCTKPQLAMEQINLELAGCFDEPQLGIAMKQTSGTTVCSPTAYIHNCKT